MIMNKIIAFLTIFKTLILNTKKNIFFGGGGRVFIIGVEFVHLMEV